MGTSKFDAWGNTAMNLHNPIQRGVEILLIASCYSSLDTLRPDGPLCSNADRINLNGSVIFGWLSTICEF